MLFLRISGVLLGGMLPYIGYAYLLYLGEVPPGVREAHLFQFAGFFWLLIIWWMLSSIWTKYYLEMWLVTNRRFISMEQPDYFDREVVEWNIERIVEVIVEKENIMQNFLDYGTLEIHTPGTDDKYERITGIPEPELMRETIMLAASRIAPLEEANKHQEELIHTISHEVKGYLSKDAASFATIAEGDAGPVVPQVSDFAKLALNETRKGVSAVMAILKGTDAKTGKISVGGSLFDACACVKTLCDELRPSAEKKGLQLMLSAPQSTCLVRGDEKQIEDLVFRNVIENAIHYTLHGSIQIVLALSPNMVICTVMDTGIGITESDMQKLFTEGGHGEHSKDINPDSTGYGLSAARTAVEAHGGSIHAMSDGAGKGSSFVITLPLAA